MKPKTKTINVPIFDRHVHFIYGADSHKKLTKAIRKLNIDTRFDREVSKTLGFCSQDGPIVVSVRSDALMHDTVPHECYHCAMRILRDAGVELFDEEIVAYLLSYLCDQFIHFATENQ